MDTPTSEIDTYPVVLAAIPPLGQMLAGLNAVQQAAINKAVATGGHVEIRIRIGNAFPTAKVFVCQASGEEIDLEDVAPVSRH